MELAKTFTTVSALAGLAYAVSKRHGFWLTAGITVISAIGGAAVGSVVNQIKND